MKYIANPELIEAKKVAQFLKRPLLLSGEPGTGKTKFADYVADADEYCLYKFDTKSTSLSTDLFYTYDAVSHFANKERSILNFIRLEPLGLAIINALGKETASSILRDRFQYNNFVADHLDGNLEVLIENFLCDCGQSKSLVLIDEVDKAPRDFPNDILNEIENYEFKIKELGISFSLKDKPDLKEHIFIILTSNVEKNLPDAFLRRCIYYHIKFPNIDVLMEIVLSHVGHSENLDHTEIKKRIEEFDNIRNKNGLQKKPATSELIDCIKYLIHRDVVGIPIRDSKVALSTIIKKESDLETI